MTNDTARSEMYLLAVQNGYNAQELVAYIDEDRIGGYNVHPELASWPSGSGWESEMQIYYALVRYLKPEFVVEIGTLYGCSTTHIATALMKNGAGRVASVDNGANGQRGGLIPLDRREVIDLVDSDGGAYLSTLPDNSVDMIFEDAGHGEEDVYRFTVLAMRKLKPGGLLINHDAGHDTAKYIYSGNIVEVPADDGAKIRAGLTRAGAQFNVYKPTESDCGFAVTVKRADPAIMDMHLPPAQTWSAPLESEGFLEPGVVIVDPPLPDDSPPNPLTDTPDDNPAFLFDGTLPTLPPDGSESMSAMDEANGIDMLNAVKESIDDSSLPEHFTEETKATEPPAKKTRKKRLGKGKT